MKDELILPILEEAAQKLSIKVSYDDLRKGEVNTPGGSCVLRGERRIIIHKKLHVREKVDVLMELLSELDFESIHLPVEVRERLEKMRAREKGAEASRGASSETLPSDGSAGPREDGGLSE